MLLQTPDNQTATILIASLTDKITSQIPAFPARYLAPLRQNISQQ